VVSRKTAGSRFRRTLRRIADWCRRHFHRPVPEQHTTLSQKLRGHYDYYGITGNMRSLSNLYHRVKGLWQKWLSRRSWHGYFSWERFRRLLGHFPLPTPVVVHSVYRGAAKL
jgi:hypothetical protein